MTTSLSQQQRILVSLLSAGIASSAGLAAQAPQWQIAAGGTMAFEVASVKPSSGSFSPPAFPLDNSDAYRPTGGRFHADFPLTVYIQFAYKYRYTTDQMQSAIAHLPKWVANDRFTIDARAPVNATKDQMRLMMQSLLADRFQLAVHFDTQEVPVFFLTYVKAGKMGPKFRLHSDGPPCDPPGTPPAKNSDIYPPICDVYMMNILQNGMRRTGSRNTTMALLADSLSSTGRLGRPVLDRSGIGERVDFMIEWAPDPDGPSDGVSGSKTARSGGPDIASPAAPAAATDLQAASFLQALREQLGLKLEAGKGPIQLLVIDKVERPSEN